MLETQVSYELFASHENIFVQRAKSGKLSQWEKNINWDNCESAFILTKGYIKLQKLQKVILHLLF